MLGPSAEATLSGSCSRCGANLYLGFARCRTCGSLRPEFEPHAAVVSEFIGGCCASGAKTDVKLPTGDYLWAPYFLDMVTEGWLDASYAFTDKCPWSRARS
jgi:hypothetical protein